MHSAIEFAKRKTEICVPQQWATVVGMARRKDPYIRNKTCHTVETVSKYKIKVVERMVDYNMQ
jgi:hypothetical protein